MEEEELATMAGLQAENHDLRAEITKLKKELAYQLKQNRIMWEDNSELSRKCKEHYDNCQKVLRFELKKPESEKRKPYIQTNDGRVVELDVE